jgi:predicted DNA-binding transcriptional regulator AlpA
MAEMAKRIVRKKEAYDRLGCGHSKFHTHYLFRTAADPYVPETQIPRLKAIPLGVRDIGFLESEVDSLIDALAALRDLPKAQAKVAPSAKAKRKPRRPQAAGAEA